MDSAWFQAFVARCHRRSSGFPSVQEWLAATHAHEEAGQGAIQGAITLSPRRVATLAAGRAVQYSFRNDVRTSSSASGSGITIDFQSINNYNIYADQALHDQAAASLAAFSQTRTGFNATMGLEDGVAVARFKAYLDDLGAAPHWLLTRYAHQEVRHEQTNHAQFVVALVNIVTDALRAVGGDDAALASATESVEQLAARLACNISEEEKQTLFASFTLNRPNTSDPVNYGVFFTIIHARYVQDRKTEVLSYNTMTFTAIFNLISGVVIQNEAAYNSVLKQSVGDWLDLSSI